MSETATAFGLPPSYRRTPLRIGCIQFDVKLGKVAENAERVKRMTQSLRPGQLDLLVLPEMALSGYMFSSPDEAAPYLETPRSGPTAVLATSLAERLRCHVIAGYPEASGEEKVQANGSSEPNGSNGANGVVTATGLNGSAVTAAETAAVTNSSEPAAADKKPVGYNSAVLASPAGEVIGNYRKTFLFETDKNWAREGDGFSYFDLPEPLGRVAIGICMDLNPKDFIAPWNAFELATYCQKNSVDVLVVPMNWLDPGEQDTDSDDDDDDLPPRNDPEVPSESNLNYWAARLAPFHDPAPAYGPTATPAKELVFVACNRTGTEAGTKFVGTSCVMTLRSNPSGIELVEVCSRSEERALICQVT